MPSGRRGWRGVLALLVGLLAGLLPGLAGAGSAAIVVDDERGHALRFEAPPARIVSLLPSLTEAVWLLGAGDRLVGVDRYSDWPAALARLPRVGGMEDAAVEAVAALQPDLVLVSGLARSAERLEALGLRVLRLRADSHDDVRALLTTLGRLLGREAEARRVVARIDADLAAAAARVPASMRGRRVYFEIHGGPWAAGAGSFVGETLARLGLVNVVPPALGPFPKLNPEYVVRADPQLVLLQQRDAATLASRPGWAGIAALRERQVCGFPHARFELLIRPGPRLGEGALAIADCLGGLPAREGGR